MPCLLVTALLALLAVTAAEASAAVPRLPKIQLEPERGIGDEWVPARVSARGGAGAAAVKVRGQWTRRLPKRSYALELRDAEGENRNAPLLGLPPDDDWVLYAAYNDRTLMRNVLAYDTARRLGGYAARSRFVELVIRGRTRGVYVLMEKLKLHPRRVKGGEGAFLLELTSRPQAPRKDPSFLTPLTRRPVVWADPERKDLSSARAAAISSKVAATERALYGGVPGAWRRHLHSRRAVDFLLLNELFKNHDGMHASTFMSGTLAGRLRLGPVWDFDMSMGMGRERWLRRPTGWMLASRPWAETLYRQHDFARALSRRWRALRAAGLRGWMLRRVNAMERRLAPAARLDLRRWPAAQHRPGGPYRHHVRRLERWLERRVAWMDANLPRLAR